jgi:hypothetical protein
MGRVLSSPNEFIARQDAIHLIELKRGSTLRLEHAAGATLRLVYGEAWLTACRGSERLRPAALAVLNGSGTILVYALADSSLRLEGVEHCEVELRRRGEVEIQEISPSAP